MTTVRLRFSRLDALLLLMTVIWGSNYSVIKSAFREIPPLGFNALRLISASALFLAAIAARRAIPRTGSNPSPTRPLEPGDWLSIVGLAIVGQFVYQILFIKGLDETTVANSSLIIACTPIFVGLMTAALGHERIHRWQWTGILLSAAGIFIVVRSGVSVSRASMRGDLTMLAAVLCWAAATVGARRVLTRQPPLVVTGYSMALGSALYLPVAWRELKALDWRAVSARTWVSLEFSAVFALCVAYMIWYTALQRIGNARTSVYSNLVPVAALAVAWAWLGEPIGPSKIVGAASILVGVALTRIQPDDVALPEPA